MAKNDVAGDDAGDADVQLKKRARRRLVGAVALVLLAVIVLPMVMDHEPRPTSPDIQVRIPSQDGAISPERVVAKPIKPLAPAATASTAAAAEKAEKLDKPAIEATKIATSDSAPAVEKLKEVPAPKAASPVPSAAEEKPVSDDGAKAAAALEGKNGTDKKAEQWVVQLGAYKDAANVKLLLGKMKEINVPAYTEKFDTPQGPRTRVRAGPFPNKDAATKAQMRIKIIGVNGPVAPK